MFDYNLFATATALFGHLMPDFKRHAKRYEHSGAAAEPISCLADVIRNNNC